MKFLTVCAAFLTILGVSLAAHAGQQAPRSCADMGEEDLMALIEGKRGQADLEALAAECERQAYDLNAQADRETDNLQVVRKRIRAIKSETNAASLRMALRYFNF